MLRICFKGANSAARKCLCRNSSANPQHCRNYTSVKGSGGSVGKVALASLLAVGGGVGGTILYAKWDHRFRSNVEKSIPYSDRLFDQVLGPITYTAPLKKPLQQSQMLHMPLETKKPIANDEAEKIDKLAKTLEESAPLTSVHKEQSLSEASAEAAQIISAISEVHSVPAPHDSKDDRAECKECAHHEHASTVASSIVEVETPADVCEPVKERSGEEVAAWLAVQDKAESDEFALLSAGLEDSLGSSAKVTLQAIEAQEKALQAIAQHTRNLKEAMEAEVEPNEKSAQWKDLEEALAERNIRVDEAGVALLQAKDELDKLRGVIHSAKSSRVLAVRPHILAAEENLHSMMVDLDHVVTKVQTAQSEAKIVSQYSELVNEAKAQFQKELNSITPEIQANWKGLTGKLTQDDLNSLIAHAHRRIDQLNRELAEHRVREQIHIEAALDQQKVEDQRAQEKAVVIALEHNKEQMRLEQEKKVAEVREVMEAEMRTQLRRQTAAHTDHLRDVLKVQEHELRTEAQEVLSSQLLDQENHHRHLTQEQLDKFTLDMNAAYARLKGIEEAIDSHVIAEEEARKAHQLWLSVEALNYTLKTSDADVPTQPLELAVEAVRVSCHDNEFAQALTNALPVESLRRGIYSEASLRSRFYALRQLARRVALIDESRNSLYQYVLSYLQAALLLEPIQEAPPAQLACDDLDTFKLLSYAAYSLEHGDLELAAKLLNQLRGEARRVAQDWLTEARLTLETKQVVGLLSAYANAVGLGTTQV